jgi:trehalose 6-phosphate phosphatase
VETIAETLRPLTDRPESAAVLCDIDGTLAPIVARAEEAAVPEHASRLLGRIARRYGVVACISGRGAAEARRIVGVGGIAYAGSHGAELLLPGQTQAELVPAYAGWADRVREFALSKDSPQLRMMRIRIEDKRVIFAFHWRGAPDEDAARAMLEGIAAEAESAGFITHWGRKVLEIRPTVRIDKGAGIVGLLGETDLVAAVYVGDDVTDLDAFRGLTELQERGRLGYALRVGVRSDETPPALEEEADALVDGPDGVRGLLRALLL